MKVILLGPPGAGKGTLASLLKDSFGIAHISTGDMLREEMKDESEIGQEISKIVENGNLVPDETVIRLIEKRISADKAAQKGFMLDGFPRTVPQAEELDRFLNKIQQPVDKALYMDADEGLIIQRLTGRRVCRKCTATYHIINRPPKKEGVCDVCGGTDLYQRPDDNEETIKNRMQVYLENTEPIIEYYRKQDKLINLDGNQSAEALEEQLKKIFDEENSNHQDQNA